jgi:hypothetical protein
VLRLMLRAFRELQKLLLPSRRLVMLSSLPFGCFRIRKMVFPARALGHFNERSLRCDWCRALRVFASFGKTFVLFMFRDLRNNQMSVASNRTE